MAEKELRRMNRTELIEIIYALQQNGKMLQQEKEELQRQLKDRTIRIENAGSIAEAALSLNRIFEDAEAAAQQYLDSIRVASQPVSPRQETAKPAKVSDLKECGLMCEETSKECDRMLEETRQECDRMREETSRECARLLEEAERQVKEKADRTNRQIEMLLKKYPTLMEYFTREFDEEGKDA
ncbi:MAG: hypothetical protein LUI14_08875 [Lachnospiraceae bacterium]|nr:hypothetical protein [Lachnospiraceae bacterium]